MAADMATAPDQSLPRQCSDWADLKAAYNFLHHEQVSPERIQSTHRQQVRQACLEHPLILAVQDTTELDFTGRQVEGLGPIGDFRGQGMQQHSTLAVLPEGRLLGVLHQIFRNRVPVPEGETLSQRRVRAKESDLWHESAEAVGSLGSGARLVHVVDQGGDDFPLMVACGRLENVGFLIRAQHNRCVEGDTNKLWPFLAAQAVAGHRDVPVPATQKHPARVARLAVRFSPVLLDRPKKDPRFKAPISVWAVYVLEQEPPAGVEPIEWMLLTSEAVHNFEQACQRVDWYCHRWLIEEWHKVEKTGCKLEDSQLKDAAAIRCLAAFTAVIAVRMIQLRDLAQIATQAQAQTPGGPADSPEALGVLVPATWRLVVACLAKCKPEALTPRLFWLTIARRGGFIGRKGDGVPGWQTIWRGWYDVMMMVQGAEMTLPIGPQPNCG